MLTSAPSEIEQLIFREAIRKVTGTEAWQREPLMIQSHDPSRWVPRHPLAQIEWTEQKGGGRTDGHYVDVVKAAKWRKRHAVGSIPRAARSSTSSQRTALIVLGGGRPIVSGQRVRIPEPGGFSSSDAAEAHQTFREHPVCGTDLATSGPIHVIGDRRLCATGDLKPASTDLKELAEPLALALGQEGPSSGSVGPEPERRSSPVPPIAGVSPSDAADACLPLGATQFASHVVAGAPTYHAPAARILADVPCPSGIGALRREVLAAVALPSAGASCAPSQVIVIDDP